jgi:thioredoxin-dependent peroxiredoxin
MNTAVSRMFAVLVLGALALGPAALAVEDKPTDLKVGDLAPVFGVVDDQGQPWKSADHVGKKYLVLYFFPGDFTPGCTRQAQNFRDAMNKLEEQGVEVVGVSGDEVKTHQLFKKAQMLNFTLISDADGSLAKMFGVPLKAGAQVKAKDAEGQPLMVNRAVTAARWTFIIGKDSKIAYKNTAVNPAKDSKDAADLIEKLEKP